MLSLNQEGATKKRSLLRLETLEDRVTPATFNVTNNNNAGAGSLRDAVSQAEATAAADIITFDQNIGTIGLDSTIQITRPLTITGRGAGATVIDGQTSVQIFRLDANAPQVTIQSLTLQNGFSSTGDGGGAIFNNFAQLTINGVTFAGNFAATNGTGRGGGAISNFQTGPLTVNDSTFINNRASRNGGAILQRSTGALTVRRSTFQANEASSFTGGGIAYTRNAAGSDIVNSTFHLNSAGTGGGVGVNNEEFFDGINGLIRISNSTITQNTANGVSGNSIFGGGVSTDLFVGGSASTVQVRLNSTVVAQNVDINGTPSDLSGNFNSTSAFNFIGSSRGILSGITNGTSSNRVGGSTAATIIDPVLGPLANNGGITLTRNPDPNSPLLDTGDPNVSTAIVGTTDQRGGSFPRIANGIIDIGSIEFFIAPPPPPDPNQPPPPVPPPPVPPPPQILNPNERIAVGSNFGAVSSVLVFASNAVPLASLNPFPGFTGGVRVATGDLNGDLVDDIVAAAGPGGGPAVVVYDGVTFQELSRFFAYAETFDGGVYVALGTVSQQDANDRAKDIITGAGAGGGPHVQVFDGRTGAILSSYFATDPSSTAGVTVAALDIDRDFIDEIVTANAFGGSPIVRIQSGITGRSRLEFLAYLPDYFGGVSLATGDLTGDGFDEIITGSANGSTHVKAYNLLSGQEVASFFAYAPNFIGGVQVSTSNFDADNTEEIVTVSGPGSSGHLKIVQRDTSEVSSTFTFDPGFLGGAYVG